MTTTTITTTIRGFVPLLLLCSLGLSQMRAQDTLQAHEAWLQGGQAADSASWERSAKEYGSAAKQYRAAGSWDRYLESATQQGRYLARNRQHEEAKRVVYRAIETSAPHLSDRRIPQASAYLWLGELERNSGELNRAEVNYRKGQDFVRPVASSNFMLWGNSMTGLAIVFALRGQFDESLARFHEARIWFTGQCGTSFYKVGDIYNDLAITFQNAGQPDSAKQYYRLTLAHMEQDDGVTASARSRTLSNLGLMYVQEGSYREADSLFALGEKLILETGDSLSFYLILPYNGLGWARTDMGDYKAALHYYQKGGEVLRHNFGPDHWELGVNHSNLGQVYEAMGALTEALNQQRQALAIYQAQLDSDNPEVALALHNIGVIESRRGNSEAALAHYRQAQEIFEKEDNPRLAFVHQSIASELDNLGDTRTAMQHYRRALELFQSRYGPEQPNIAMVYAGMGDIRRQQGDTAAARELYRQSLAAVGINFGPYHPDAVDAYRGMAQLSLDAGDYSAALRQYDHAIRAVVPEFEGWDRPLPDNFYRPANPTLLAATLELRGQALKARHEEEGDPSGADLILALESCSAGVEMLDRVRREFRSEDVQLDFTLVGLPLLDLGVSLGAELYQLTGEEDYLDRAFGLADRRTGTLLAEAWQRSEARDEGVIPEATLTLEDSLKRELYRMRAGQDQYGGGEDSLSSYRLQRRYFVLQQALDSLENAIDQQHPIYAKARYAESVGTASRIRQRLDPNSALIEYYPIDSICYIFVLTRDAMQLRECRLPGDLEQRILSLRNLYHRDSLNRSGQDWEAYLSLTGDLYQQLIQPLELEDQIERLIIVPQGQLAYLPMGMLADPGRGTGFRDGAYLLRDYSIAYAYSAATWSQTRRRRHHPRYEYAGFAPSYKAGYLADLELDSELLAMRGDLLPLSHTLDEVQYASGIFKGEVFSGDRATESMFKARSRSSRILHLAMHGLVEDQQPLQSRLIFAEESDGVEDGLLHAWELYGLELNADMAVLSACNTGYGQLAEGEGVMSLARAFRYAGCGSVVMSLWKAQDEVTAEIVSSFYEQLAEGKSKDEALRLAKLEFLDRGDPLLSNPYFWSGLVVIGDPSPIDPHRQTRQIWVLALIILVVSVLGMGWLRRQEREG